jgi:hypothetical protein
MRYLAVGLNNKLLNNLLFSQKKINCLEIKSKYIIWNSQKFKEIILGTLGTQGTLSTLKIANHNRVNSNK